MNKQIGSIMLVAGTCIGSGMIALPLVLAPLGLLPSVLLMIITWALAYYTALIHLELNLQAGTGLDLAQLALRFGGPTSYYVSNASLKILSYALLAVYIFGGSSILEKLLSHLFNYQVGFVPIATVYCILGTLLLSLPIGYIDKVNRLLFTALLSIALLLIGGLAYFTPWSNIPMFVHSTNQWTLLRNAIPVVFTSFGFQVIFHTLTNYCNNNSHMLKRAFFWGSSIPALVYIIWTTTVVTTIAHHNAPFYMQLTHAQVSIADLIKELSLIATGQSVQLLVWILCLLAVFTSVLGVGAGMRDSLYAFFSQMNGAHRPYTGYLPRLLSAIVTMAPAYVSAIIIPNAFITVLGFAGMILVCIAILIPLYLLWQLSITQWHYQELRHTWLLVVCALAGLFILYCEVSHLL